MAWKTHETHLTINVDFFALLPALLFFAFKLLASSCSSIDMLPGEGTLMLDSTIRYLPQNSTCCVTQYAPKWCHENHKGMTYLLFAARVSRPNSAWIARLKRKRIATVKDFMMEIKKREQRFCLDVVRDVWRELWEQEIILRLPEWKNAATTLSEHCEGECSKKSIEKNHLSHAKIIRMIIVIVQCKEIMLFHRSTRYHGLRKHETLSWMLSFILLQSNGRPFE